MILKEYKLNNGEKIPSIGLGTWKSQKGDVGEAVKVAIELGGYRHIDCASIYKNQEEIGVVFNELFKKKKINRSKMFITSKLWNTEHKSKDVIKAFKKTLSDLQLDYLDLYLIHWGIAFKSGNENEPLDKDGFIKTDNVSIRETWESMEKLVKLGLVKSIGVSNFTSQSIIELLTYCKIRPVVNQIELHPYNSQQDFINYLQHEKILPTGYSPLGTPGVAKTKDGPSLITEKIITKLAKKYKKTPAQILINWGVSRGTVVIPKSVTKERIISNINSLDFEMSKEEYNLISQLNRNYRFVNPIGWWKIPYFN